MDRRSQAIIAACAAAALALMAAFYAGQAAAVAPEAAPADAGELLRRVAALESKLETLSKQGAPGGDLVVGHITAETISAKLVSVSREDAETVAYLSPTRIGFVKDWQAKLLDPEKSPTAGWCFLSPGALQIGTAGGKNEIWLMSDSDGRGAASIRFDGQGGKLAEFGLSAAGRLLVRGEAEAAH